MELDEIKERYKMLPLWGRLLALAILGLLPGAYTVWDEQDGLDAALLAAQSEEETLKHDFESKVSQKGDLPKLEEKKAFTQEQLEKTKKKLPDGYRIEEILRRLATISKETGATLAEFKPNKEEAHNGEYRYFELPIGARLNGKFQQIAAFFDRVVHLEGTVFIRDIKMMPIVRDVSGANANGVGASGNSQNGEGDYDAAVRLRQDLQTSATFQLVAYRAVTEVEAAKLDAQTPAAAPGGPGAAAGASGGAKPPAGAAPGQPAAAPQASTTVVGGSKRM